MSYNLHSATYAEGEVYYSNTPVSIIVNRSGEVSFQCAIKPSGDYIGEVSPSIPFNIATNLDEYKSRPSESDLPYRERGLYYTDSTIIRWSSYLLYYMNRDKELRARPELIGTLDFNVGRRILGISHQLDQEHFPEGSYYYLYLQRQLAKRAIDRSDS